MSLESLSSSDKVVPATLERSNGLARELPVLTTDDSSMVGIESKDSVWGCVIMSLWKAISSPLMAVIEVEGQSAEGLEDDC